MIRIYSPNIFFLHVKIMKINKPLKIFKQSMNLKNTFYNKFFLMDNSQKFKMFT